MAQNDFSENLMGILQPVVGNITDTFSTALNKKVTVSLGEIRPTDIDELNGEFPAELVVVKSTFIEGLSDDFFFLLTPELTAILADLMLMGEGTAEFNADEHLDAIAELFSQVGGVLSTYLSNLGGGPVQMEAFNASLNPVEAHADQWATFFSIDFQMDIEGLEPARIIAQISSQTIEEIQSFGAGEEEGQMEDRPPPAVLDEDMFGDFGGDDQPEVRPASFEDFGPVESGGSTPQNIEALMDLDLPVIIELGRTSMFIRDILDLSPGSIVELNKLSGEPVDLYINDKRFARGEVVVIDENFGIRITDLIKVEDRIRSLR